MTKKLSNKQRKRLYEIINSQDNNNLRDYLLILIGKKNIEQDSITLALLDFLQDVNQPDRAKNFLCDAVFCFSYSDFARKATRSLFE